MDLRQLCYEGCCFARQAGGLRVTGLGASAADGDAGFPGLPRAPILNSRSDVSEWSPCADPRLTSVTESGQHLDR
jgi:hypothetical protein